MAFGCKEKNWNGIDCIPGQKLLDLSDYLCVCVMETKKNFT